jgi:hypothetical protein
LGGAWELVVSCNCASCKFTRRYLREIAPVRSKFLEDVLLRLEAAETERDVNRLVIEGRWPSSAEILKAHGWVRSGDGGAVA